jgi:nucleoid-associated protein YgaU
MGQVGNNGTLDNHYAATITNRTLASSGGAFRGGAVDAMPTANFDQSLERINSYNQGSSGGGYTVREGDTLASIAANLWGDSALWYKIAEANGLTGQAALSEGQTLNLPTAGKGDTHSLATIASV